MTVLRFTTNTWLLSPIECPSGDKIPPIQFKGYVKVIAKTSSHVSLESTVYLEVSDTRIQEKLVILSNLV